MLSQRIGSLQQNRIALLYGEKFSQRPPAWDLTQNNPTLCGFAYPDAAIAGSYEGKFGQPYMPEPFGLDVARVAICEYLQRHGMTFCEPARLMLTASTSEAYALLIKLLCDPGDQILAPQPSYPLVALLAAFESVETVPYELHYFDRWSLVGNDLTQKTNQRTRAVVAINPNNPTGSTFTSDEWAEVLGFCADRGLPLIVDEVFARYEWDGRAAPLHYQHRDALTFAMGGLSKEVGLPQLKLAWTAWWGPESRCQEIDLALGHLADHYLSVSQPVQLAAASLLQAGEAITAQVQKRVRDNYRSLGEMLAGSMIRVLHAEAGWSAILQLPSLLSAEEWTLALLEEEIYVQPGYFFDLPQPSCVVVSLLITDDIFHTGIRRLRARVEKEYQGR